MAAKIKINSRRMTPSLVAERGDAHPCDGAEDDVPRNPGGEPGAVKKYTGTDEKTAESSAARRRLVLALGRLAHRQRPILVGDEPGDEKRATGGESGEGEAKRCSHEDEAQAEEE